MDRDEEGGVMTQRLYRIILVTTVLAWLQVGMRLSHAASVKDAGRTPELSEWLVLVLLAILGTAGIVALWQQPAARTQGESTVPAA
jgi:hypothetical protein